MATLLVQNCQRRSHGSALLASSARPSTSYGNAAGLAFSGAQNSMQSSSQWRLRPKRMHMRRHRPSSAVGSSRDKAEQRGSSPVSATTAREAPPGMETRPRSTSSREGIDRSAAQESSEASTSGAQQQLQVRTTDVLGMARSSWGNLPARTKIVVASSAAFFFSNLDKVILSIAIIPMAAEMGWSPSVAGLVQSSFFYGYILVQLPGGYIITRTGGRRILPAGVGLWSLATAAVPFAVATIPTLCVARSLVGLGQGLAPASASDIIARTVPNAQRSGAVARVFSGLQLGSIAALLAGPAIIQVLGWRASFYIFGASGVLWCVWWEQLLGSTYDSGTAAIEKAAVDQAAAAATAGGGQEAQETAVVKAVVQQKQHRRHLGEEVEEEEEVVGKEEKEEEQVPWRAFLREPAMQGLMYVHFCNNWFHYTMLAWLPTFYIQTLDLDLIAASQLALLPPIAAFAGSNVAGPLADRLIESGTATVMVRKGMQGVAFVVPSVLLAGAAASSAPSESHMALVAFLTLSLGFNAFTMAGLYSNHADLSPKHCSALLSLTNTAGALPGIIGVPFTGLVLQRTDDWSLALFLPCIFFFLTGFAVYMATASSDQKEFSNNEPFAYEPSLKWLPWRKAEYKSH